MNDIAETKTKKNEGKFGRLLRLFLVLMVVMAIAVAGVVVYVDPFFHYHAPLEGFPYIVDNQLSQNPGMARNFEYNSCIIGSSMTVNFDTDDFRDIMGLDTVKLSYSGAYPKDDYNILSIVFDKSTYSREKSPVDAVFIAMDIPTMAADTETIKYPLPEHLYDSNFFNDVNYVLNKDVLLEYILRPMIQGKGSDLSEIYFSWWTPEYYNIQWVMHTYEEPAKNETELEHEALIEPSRLNLEKNILPFVEENKDTQFFFFFPPYSILYWHNIMQDNSFEATMNQYRFVADTLLQYDNVSLFYFQTMDEVTDLNNYADYSHYKPEINRYMVECFKDGTHQIHSSREMEEELNKMRDIINEFDFEALFSVDWG